MLFSAVSSRPPFRFQPLLRLAVLPGDLPDDQEQDQGDHRRRQRGGDDQESGLLAPVGQRGGDRVGRDDDDRETAQRGRGSEPVRFVDRALHAQRLLAALGSGHAAAAAPLNFCPIISSTCG